MRVRVLWPRVLDCVFLLVSLITVRRSPWLTVRYHFITACQVSLLLFDCRRQLPQLTALTQVLAAVPQVCGFVHAHVHAD